MATKKNSTAAKSPAQVLREQKAKIEEIHANGAPPPRMPTERHPASDAAEAAGKARGAIGALAVPITLDDVCGIIGVDCKAESFAASALECLAGQLVAMQTIGEQDSVDPYNAYRVIENVVGRMRLASRVTAWLESETPLTRLPEVSP
jgi:hypothetical protein